MKSKLTLILLLLFIKSALAQTTIFSENIGTPSGTTTIAANTFQNNGTLTYSNGSQANSADVRSTNASTSYFGASGGGNVYFTTTSGTYGFAIEGINASQFTTMYLQFGYKKESVSTHANFSVDYWNGTSWISLANTSTALFHEASGASALWYLSKGLPLPTDAQINGLKIRFVKTGTTAIRIDDIKLTGIETLPSVTNTLVSSITTNSALFAGDVTATGGSSIIDTGTVFSPTSTNANPILGGSGITALSTSSPNSGAGSFSNNTGTVLSANVQYSYNAFATKSTGATGYGTVETFYTLAIVPSAPIVDSPSATSLHVAIGSDANSTITTYAILETSTGKYVQTDGSLGTPAVYQTANSWGTKTVTGLSPTTTYTFKVIAKNGAGILTSTGSSVNGTTLVASSITASGTLSALNSVYGTASSFTSFTVIGNNLTDNIVISVPTGFEVSKTSGGTSGYASTQTLIPVSGQVSSTTIYVRLTANTPYGTYAGNITLTSTNDGLNVNVPTVSSSVAKLELNITGITILNKAYDGNTQATISGTAALNGVISTDINNVGFVNGSGSASFADSSIGNAKPVTVSGYAINGTASGNYSLIQPSGFTADITANISSDVTLNLSSSTNNNTNINYTLYQGTTLSNTGTGINGSIGVLGFYLRDGGAAMNDADNLPTELTDIDINVINPANIRSARLFVGNSPRGNAIIHDGSSVLHFTGLTNIVAPDNDQLAISLRVTFKSTVIDNQQIGFIINGLTAKSDGSLFSSINGGGVNSLTTGDINRIEVTADRLVFVQQPPVSLLKDTDMNPSPSLASVDLNGNRDLDFTGVVSITSSGILNSSPQTATASQGLSTFNSIRHTATGSGLILTAAYSGLTSAESSSFTVQTVPLFDQIAPICAGTDLSLPTTSLNGIAGTWSPEINNLETTTYTFTPTGGQYATNTTLTLAVNPVVIPEFASIEPICMGAALMNLPTTSINGYSGTWSPALDNSVTTTYVFTPGISNSCVSPTTLTIDVNPPVIPTFEEIGTKCSGSELSDLPTSSIEGVIGTWSPELNNQTTTTYTFTPNDGQCAITSELTIVISPNVLPTFEPIEPICSGSDTNILPPISLEGLSGTWSPSFDSSTTKTYTFDPGTEQCALKRDITIIVNPSITPTFDSVSPICSGESLSELPTTSLNGIIGRWTPELDNMVTTTYTFIPEDNQQCATTTVLSVTINPNEPIFNSILPICAGEILDELPTTSINGYTGTWSPSLDNTKTTMYTFLPDEGQCASATTLTITVNEITPVFDELQTICIGTDLMSLPTTTSNGTTGVWSSQTDNNITRFTFTPNVGQCATNSSFTVDAVQDVIPTFDIVEPIAIGGQLQELPTISLNGISGTWSPGLNNTETTLYTFTPDQVQCATTTTLTIEVSGEGEQPEDNPQSPQSVSLEVGMTPGELSVSPSGAANYSIPIKTPPGINGIEPRINLNYDSQSGVGLAGYCWNLNGISSIKRIPSTKFHDDVIDPVDFDTYDRFALDGQRLMLKSGVYGANNSVYETENFSNLKVTLNNNTFKVEYPDGSIAFYEGHGSTPNLGILNYLITYWENPQHIRINYSYIHSFNTSYIYSIKYGSVGSNTPINEIQFVYKSRVNPLQSYEAGVNIGQEKILSQIRVRGNNAGYRNYFLSHDIVSGYERLTSILEKNGDGSKSYNPIIFEYYESPTSNSIIRTEKLIYVDGNTTPAINPIDIDPDLKPEKLISGDFDGNGEQDFVYDGKLYCNLVDNNSTPTIYDFKNLLYLVGPGINSYEYFKCSPAKCLRQYSDGFKIINKDALCYREYGFVNGVGYKSIKFHIFSKNETSNSVQHEYSKVLNIDFANPSQVETFSGDFNGDGLTDEMVFKKSAVTFTHSSNVYFLNLDPRITSNYVKNLGTIDNLSAMRNDHIASGNSHVYVADFNGDGKSDIITFKGDLNKIVVYSLDKDDNLIVLWETPINYIKRPIIFTDYTYSWPYWSVLPTNETYYNYVPVIGDLNGDGKSDVILSGLERLVLMSTGVSFVSEGLPSNYPSTRDLAYILPADYDNDGKLNIIAYKTTSAHSFNFRNLYRKGAGNWVSNSYSFSSNTNLSNCGNEKFNVTPFMVNTSKQYPDKPQIVTFESFVNGPCNNKRDFVFYTNQNVNSINKLIKKVTNGNGIEETVNYSPLISGGIGTYVPAGQLSNYPYYDIGNTPSIKVVSQIEMKDSKSSKRQVYRYYGATSNVEGLGFAGFRSLLKTNWFVSISTAISNVVKNDITLRGAPTSSFSILGFFSPNVNINASSPYINKSFFSYNNSNTEPFILQNKVFKLRNTFTQNFNGLDGNETSVSSIYDVYNLKKKTTINGNSANPNDTKTTEEEFDYDDLPTSIPYVIGRLKKTKTKTTLSPGNDISIYEQQNSYSNNLLTEVKTGSSNSSTPPSLYNTKTNEYNSFGNLTKTTFSAPNMINRVTNYVYDATHRFLTKKIDILGQVTDYTYDLSRGLLLTETHPYSGSYFIKTKWDYDSWGKKIRSTNYFGNTPALIINETYANLNGGYISTSLGNDGSGTKIIYDGLGRKIHEQVKDINDKWSCISTVYDEFGRTVKISEPYFINAGLGNFTVWNEMQYDVNDRLKQSNTLKSNTSLGKQTTYKYNGLSTTEDNDLRQKVTVKDNFGNIKSISETGGGKCSF